MKMDLIWLAQYNIDLVERDGKMYKRVSPLPSTLCTVKSGLNFRHALDLDRKDFDKSPVKHVVYIPSYCDVTPNFIQGLFGSSVCYFSDTSNNKDVGFENFLAKYSLRRESNLEFEDEKELLLRPDIRKFIKSIL